MSDEPARILVVEDNPTDVYILQKALERAQVTFELTHLENGEAAMEFLLGQARLPDLIVLDINLPRITGDELLRHIRKSPCLERIPVIVLTGVDDVSIAQYRNRPSHHGFWREVANAGPSRGSREPPICHQGD